MHHLLKSTLAVFRANLGEIRSNFEFLALAARIRPRMGRVLRWEGLKDEEKRVAQDFMKHSDIELGSIHRGLIVTIAGAFEEFVGSLVHARIRVIDESESEYSRLDRMIADRNIRYTGMALATIAQPIDYLGLDFVQLCKNIGSCHTGSSAFRLNGMAFRLNVGNLNSKRLTEVFARVGYQPDWNYIGASASLKKLMDKKRTRDCTKEVKNYLDQFVRIRNQAAHSASGGLTLEARDVEFALSFFDECGSLLAEGVDSAAS